MQRGNPGRSGEPQDQEWELRFQDLRKRFLEQAEADVQRMRHLLVSPSFCESDREELCTLAHRLSGSAGSYECPDLGSAARSLLMLARESRGEGSNPGLRRRVEEVEARLSDVRAETSGQAMLPAADSAPIGAQAGDAPFDVVCIEDDPNIALLIRIILEDLGARVEVVRDGAEGLERLIQGEPPRLVLLDLMLPGRSGAEILEALQQDDSVVTPPILVLSAKASSEVRERSLRAGARGFLAKPFEPSELEHAVWEVMG